MQSPDAGASAEFIHSQQGLSPPVDRSHGGPLNGEQKHGHESSFNDAAFGTDGAVNSPTVQSSDDVSEAAGFTQFI